MSTSSQPDSVAWTLTLARCAADVANFCDHAEHNEATDRDWVLGSARALRGLSCEVAEMLGEDLQARYAARLRAIEQRNPLSAPGAPDGGALAWEAATWRELQLVQVRHDRHYHPDVLGLSKLGQLHHYALHVSKLCGACADLAQGRMDPEDFAARRLPDMLLFGIKLSTVLGQALPEKPLGEQVGERVLMIAGA